MSRRDILKVEQDHHKKAFEVYASCGPKRSYDQVARELGVSVSSIKHWSRSFDWRSRLKEREASDARRRADRILLSSAKVRERNLKMVEIALLRTAQDIAQGRVKPQMGDLDRLIRLEEQLLAAQRQRQEGALPELHDPEALMQRALRLVVELMSRYPGGLEQLRTLTVEPQILPEGPYEQETQIGPARL